MSHWFHWILCLWTTVFNVLVADTHTHTTDLLRCQPTNHVRTTIIFIVVSLSLAISLCLSLSISFPHHFILHRCFQRIFVYELDSVCLRACECKLFITFSICYFEWIAAYTYAISVLPYFDGNMYVCASTSPMLNSIWQYIDWKRTNKFELKINMKMMRKSSWNIHRKTWLKPILLPISSIQSSSKNKTEKKRLSIS